MKVIAIDPGESVGWATAEATGTMMTAQGTKVVEPELRPTGRGVTPLKDFIMKFGEVVGDYDVVVYETWRLSAVHARKFSGNEMLPSQLIGMIRYLLWLHPSVKVVPLAPAMKQKTEKSFPDYLKEYIKNSNEEHDKDAVQLLWAWFFRDVL